MGNACKVLRTVPAHLRTVLSKCSINSSMVEFGAEWEWMGGCGGPERAGGGMGLEMNRKQNGNAGVGSEFGCR